MKINILIVFYLINIHFLIAQQVIIGSVFDINTRMPINSVSIIDKNNIGTLTDNNGMFKINKINKINNKFFISHIGYDSKEIIIDSQNYIIFLHRNERKLNNIALKSSVFQIILDAISKIKQNYYYDNQIILDGIFKQIIIDSGKDYNVLRGIYDQELSQKMLYPAYKNINQYPLINYKKMSQRIYRIDSLKKNSPESNFVLSLIDICDADFVLKRKNFIQTNSNKYYKYISNGYKVLNGRKVIEIYFFKSKYKFGTLYIDSTSRAFYACNYYEYKEKWYETPLYYRNIYTEYDIDSNSKWAIKKINIETKYKKNFIMKQYYYSNNVSVFNLTDSIDFKNIDVVDFRKKRGIPIDTIFNKDIFNNENKLMNSYILENIKLRLEERYVNQNKIKKQSFVAALILNTDFINYLFNIQFLSQSSIWTNLNIKVRILNSNFYAYTATGRSNYLNFNINLPHKITNRIESIGYKIPFKKYHSKYFAFIYSGYQFEKYELHNKTIFSQSNLYFGCQIEKKINRYLGILLDIGSPILKLKNFNNTENINYRNLQIGLGFSFRFN